MAMMRCKTEFRLHDQYTRRAATATTTKDRSLAGTTIASARSYDQPSTVSGSAAGCSGSAAAQQYTLDVIHRETEARRRRERTSRDTDILREVATIVFFPTFDKECNISPHTVKIFLQQKAKIVA